MFQIIASYLLKIYSISIECIKWFMYDPIWRDNVWLLYIIVSCLILCYSAAPLSCFFACMTCRIKVYRMTLVRCPKIVVPMTSKDSEMWEWALKSTMQLRQIGTNMEPKVNLNDLERVLISRWLTGKWQNIYTRYSFAHPRVFKRFCLCSKIFWY